MATVSVPPCGDGCLGCRDGFGNDEGCIYPAYLGYAELVRCGEGGGAGPGECCIQFCGVGDGSCDRPYEWCGMAGTSCLNVTACCVGGFTFIQVETAGSATCGSGTTSLFQLLIADADCNRLCNPCGIEIPWVGGDGFVGDFVVLRCCDHL